MTQDSSRREFLRWSAGFSILGAGAPLALQLTAAGSASAATASDYKALVCLFLQGGQDSNNLVLATDPDSWARYTSARNTGADPINLMAVGTPPATAPTGTRKDKPKYWGGVLPITPKTAQPIPAGTVVAGPRTFALHPLMAPAVPLFEQGRLAVLANVGMLAQPTSKADFEGHRVALPPQLFSHSDQQQAWQTCALEATQTGWGGRFGDMLAAQNGAQPVFTAVTADATALFLSGSVVNQYQVNIGANPGVPITGRSGSLFGSAVGGATLNSIINTANGPSSIANDYAGVVQRSIAAAGTINAAVTGLAARSIPAPPVFNEPILGFADVNPWTAQLHTIAQLIAAAPALGVKRQVFFARLEVFDTHDGQNPREARNLAQLAQALAYFDAALSNVGGVDMRSNVTTFTASDFSRSFTSNGSGTDHAWGGHHLILGGAVNGGDIYGQYPTLGIDKPGFNNPDISGNNMIPTTAIDQYGATLGRWFGVSDSDIRTIFPRLGGFAQPYLGFV